MALHWMNVKHLQSKASKGVAILRMTSHRAKWKPFGPDHCRAYSSSAMQSIATKGRIANEPCPCNDDGLRLTDNSYQGASRGSETNLPNFQPGNVLQRKLQYRAQSSFALSKLLKVCERCLESCIAIFISFASSDYLDCSDGTRSLDRGQKR